MDVCNILCMEQHGVTATRAGSLKRSSSFKKLLKLPIWGSGEKEFWCVVGMQRARAVSRTTCRYRVCLTGDLGIESWQEQISSFFIFAGSLWAPEGYSGRGSQSDRSFPLLLKLRIRGALPPLYVLVTWHVMTLTFLYNWGCLGGGGAD